MSFRTRLRDWLLAAPSTVYEIESGGISPPDPWPDPPEVLPSSVPYRRGDVIVLRHRMMLSPEAQRRLADVVRHQLGHDARIVVLEEGVRLDVIRNEGGEA